MSQFHSGILADAAKTPLCDHIGYDKLHVTGDSHRWSLMPKAVTSHARVMRFYGPSKVKTILSPTAHVGADDRLMANYLYPSATITSIEKEPEAYKCLVANTKECKNVVALHNDCTSLVVPDGFRYDLIYFDPPFGPNYYKAKSGTLWLTFEGLPLVDYIHVFREIGKCVVVKLPKNLDPTSIASEKHYAYQSVTDEKTGHSLYSLAFFHGKN